MAKFFEDTTGKIRSLPVNSTLKRILIAAADMSDVDTVRVTSGGQMSLAEAKAKGAKLVPNSKKWRLPSGRIVRTGSTRHDNGKAADLELEVNGKKQSFNSTTGRKFFEDFAEFSVSLGCTGLGAGLGYMGEHRIHVGFGNPAVWNPGSTPLAWLVKAVARGKANPIDLNQIAPPPGYDMSGIGFYRVVAGSGLRLRGGPGTEFETLELLEFGAKLEVVSRFLDWAQVDLKNDGIADGYVHGAFIESDLRGEF